jgi:hypothetical protein
MSIVISDEETVKALASAAKSQEVHAHDGRLLGHFVPAGNEATIFPELGISDVELYQMLSDPNQICYTPDEVMARLREIDRCTS